MKKIKNIIYYAAAALLSLSMTACVEDIVAELGEQDHENCHGVYFPAQDGTGDIQIDPNDPTSFKFTIKRTNARGELRVPIKIESNHDGMFSTSEVYFEEDSPTTELEVYFPSAKMGVTYECTLMIDGDEYVSKYSNNASFLSFKVTRVKWNRLVGDNGATTGLWRDGVFAEWFNLANPNLEQKVEIYERDDKPGYYRIYDVYNTAYMTQMFGMDASSVCLEKNYTYIDATDPDKVWIPTFRTGLVMSTEYGECSIASYVTENEEFDASISSVYGKLENGIITFPANSLQLNFAILGWYPTNTYGLHRIILPGYRAIENNISLEASMSDKDGYLPVKVSFGQDISTVKLVAYKGSLAESMIAETAEGIAAGIIPTNIDDVKSSKTLQLSFEETGLYTLIAVGLDNKGKLSNYTSTSFGYLKSGDEKEVVLNYGLLCSDKYYPDGLTSENSLEIYINGKDIERLYAGLYEKENWDNNQNQIRENIRYSQMSQESLDLINGKGLSLVEGGLVPGTEYVLLLVAYNGYTETEFIATAKTGGEWDYRLAYYSSADINYDKFVSSADAFLGEWNYYAMEAGLPSRSYLGKVQIENSNTTYQGTPCVKVSGLFPFLRNYYKVKNDAMDFYYYEGFLWNYEPTFDYFIYEGMYVYTNVMLYGSDGAAYNGYGGILGAYVEKQGKECIAFVDSGAAESMGITFNGLALLGFEDADFTIMLGLLDMVESMILVDPANDPDPIVNDTIDYGDGTASSSVSEEQLEMFQRMARMEPVNYVETYNGHMMSLIDKIRAGGSVKNYLDGSTAKIVTPSFDLRPAACTVR